LSGVEGSLSHNTCIRETECHLNIQYSCTTVTSCRNMVGMRNRVSNTHIELYVAERKMRGERENEDSNR
jgi:hypothetical protein